MSEFQVEKIIIGKNYGIKYNELDVFDILCIMRRLYGMLNKEQQENMIKILEDKETVKPVSYSCQSCGYTEEIEPESYMSNLYDNEDGTYMCTECWDNT